jgi:hypothetical protein
VIELGVLVDCGAEVVVVLAVVGVALVAVLRVLVELALLA